MSDIKLIYYTDIQESKSTDAAIAKKAGLGIKLRQVQDKNNTTTMTLQVEKN